MQDLDPIAALEYRVSELERQNGQMLQPARVTYVYRKAGEAGIKSDRDDGTWLGYVDVTVDGKEIQRRPFMTMRHGEDKTFWLPSENECGMLFSPSGDYANGIFAPGIVFAGFPAHIPNNISLEIFKTIFRDGSVREINTGSESDKHYNDYEIPHNNGRIERRVGKTTLSIQKQTRDIIEDKVNGATEKLMEDEGDYLKEINIPSGVIEDKVNGATEKLMEDEGDYLKEINIPSGVIENIVESGRIENIVATVNKIRIEASSITLEKTPLIKIELTATGITLTAPIVNVIGILQVGGVPLIVP